MKNLALLFCKALLVVSIVFWSFVLVRFMSLEFSSNEDVFLLRMLILLEPLFFTIALGGVFLKVRTVYLSAIVFVVLNSVLSLTDEIGLYDKASLILSLVLFVSLISIWKHIFPDKIVLFKKIRILK